MITENFNYQNNKLFIEKTDTEDLIRRYGTPLYLYSYSCINRNVKAYKDAFLFQKTFFCYACKANSNLGLLNIIRDAGWGADIVSAGELYVCRKAGIPANKIVYSSVGKREDEIMYAIRAGILMFNVESEGELESINRIAVSLNKKARISLRVNPNVNPRTHHYISTGMSENKFGIDIEKAEGVYRKAMKLKGIEVVGCQMHIGSQLTNLRPVVEAAKKVIALANRLINIGIPIRYLDLGGGLGITYKNEKPPTPKELANKILPLMQGMKITLILEPGRSIIGNAGVLLTKVLYVKKKERRNFVIVDAAMNDLIRPSFYDAYHEIVPVHKNNRRIIKVDVVGPVCESGDFLARNRRMQETEAGEYLCIQSAGAYGFSMSSNYNLRLRPAEVLVKGNMPYLIRERETLSDLLNHQRNVPFGAFRRMLKL